MARHCAGPVKMCGWQGGMPGITVAWLMRAKIEKHSWDHDCVVDVVAFVLLGCALCCRRVSRVAAVADSEEPAEVRLTSG